MEAGFLMGNPAIVFISTEVPHLPYGHPLLQERRSGVTTLFVLRVWGWLGWCVEGFEVSGVAECLCFWFVFDEEFGGYFCDADDGFVDGVEFCNACG